MAYQRVLFINFLCILFISIFIFSCWKTIDITNDNIFRGNYYQDMLIISKKDLIITNENYLWDHPLFLDIVKKGGVDSDYKGILSEGTKLKIIRIELFSHIENGHYIYPIALVLDGKWKGEEVNLHYTSKPMDNSDNNSLHISTLDIDPDCFRILYQ